MSERYRSIVDVYVLLRRNGKILLMERANTGYADGQLCPPSGHLEQGESVIDGAIREAAEEVGITLTSEQLSCAHVVHHRNSDGQGRIGFFFAAARWRGEPTNREPHKCAGLSWADPDDLPRNTVGYTAAAVAQIQAGHGFSIHGWDGIDGSGNADDSG
ncbi:NUDIX domain-containing protein [Frankia sp. CiP3]|uniref:NUDIX hydrolase n=1 Tax=Frankia sp. CiP3 TaxID=2880971 RepID=UPI002103F45C|nr:NUDIX domain-containing protein [Frankia sp. CiP3]